MRAAAVTRYVRLVAPASVVPLRYHWLPVAALLVSSNVPAGWDAALMVGVAGAAEAVTPTVAEVATHVVIRYRNRTAPRP